MALNNNHSLIHFYLEYILKNMIHRLVHKDDKNKVEQIENKEQSVMTAIYLAFHCIFQKKARAREAQ